MKRPNAQARGGADAVGSRAARAGSPIRRVAVIHGDVADEAQRLLEQAQMRFQPELIHLSYITPVLGVHVGPGALGVVVEWEN